MLGITTFGWIGIAVLIIAVVIVLVKFLKHNPADAQKANEVIDSGTGLIGKAIAAIKRKVKA